jgi:membrane-bound serine protease (ClpP class)
MKSLAIFLFFISISLGVSAGSLYRTGLGNKSESTTGTGNNGSESDGKIKIPILDIVLPFGIPFQYIDPDPSGGASENSGGVKTETPPARIVYTFELNEEIDPPSWRQTQTALHQAREMNAACVLIHMNTFGGALDAADNIRQHILDYDRPVMVWVDRNAASAGALISLACDSIYMSRGASIGAATVVDQNGTPAPEKYQSYMRSLLRATAEANSRDPRIAEAMNDPRIHIEGVNDSGKVLSFTTSEAIKNRFCEAESNSITEVLNRSGYADCRIVAYTPTFLDKIINFLLLPLVSGLLIMLIIGGIYFELQSPGVGFPLVAAITGAILYFAPLYLEGLAAHWEILLFIVGVILLMIELVAIPGFGVVGITGVVLIVIGLALALVGSLPDGGSFALPDWAQFGKTVLLVLLLVSVTLFTSIWAGERFFGTRLLGRLILTTEQNSGTGYVSTIMKAKADDLNGKIGQTITLLRPSGKIEIEGEQYDATAESGYIEPQTAVKVISIGVAQVVVRKIS